MRILQTDFHGDHNLGLFGKASDKLCVLGNFVSDADIEKIGSILEVDIVKATIANTDLIGIFSCMNSNGIILPKITTNRELEMFKKLGFNVEVVNSKFTALGNLVLCNDNGAVISRLFSRKNKKIIEDCLGVSSEYSSVAGMHTVGSCGVATNKGCLLHRDASENEIETIESVLKVNVDIGTANFGSPFVGSCVIANSHGVILGQSTSGPEANRVLEALNLL